MKNFLSFCQDVVITMLAGCVTMALLGLCFYFCFEFLEMKNEIAASIIAVGMFLGLGYLLKPDLGEYHSFRTESAFVAKMLAHTHMIIFIASMFSSFFVTARLIYT